MAKRKEEQQQQFIIDSIVEKIKTSALFSDLMIL